MFYLMTLPIAKLILLRWRINIYGALVERY